MKPFTQRLPHNNQNYMQSLPHHHVPAFSKLSSEESLPFKEDNSARLCVVPPIVTVDKASILFSLYAKYLHELDSMESGLLISDSKFLPATLSNHLLEKDILQQTKDKFPFIYVTPSTLRQLKRREMQQNLSFKVESLLPSFITKKVEEMKHKQEALLQMLHKDLTHASNLQQHQYRCYQERCVRMTLQSKRAANAMAQKYFHNYELQLKSKLQNPRTSEEQTFIETFDKSLNLYKQQIRECKKYAKERKGFIEQKVCSQLESFEKYCHEQYAMLIDALEKEKKNRDKIELNHRQMLLSKKREVRDKLEKEIKQLQQAVYHWEDDVQHYRDLDRDT